MKRLMLVFLMMGLLVPVGYTQVDLETLSGEAFTAIVEAEDAGGEVDELLTQLNYAFMLVEEGSAENLTEARRVLEGVLVEAEVIRVAGVREGNLNAGVAIVKVVVLVAAAAVVWLRGDDYFWRLWRRTKDGFVVA